MAKNGDKPTKFLPPELKAQEKPPPAWKQRAAFIFRPRVLGWLINIITAALVTLIIMPHGESALEEWEEVEIAPRDFKVPADREIRDEEGTRKKREEAAAKVQAVYDFDAQVPEKLRKKIAAFFGQLRELYPPPPEPASGATTATREDLITVPLSFLPEKEEEAVRAIGVELSEEDLKLLKKAEFSPELEQGLLLLLKSVYSREDGSGNYIVPSREEVLKEKDKGIIARPLSPKGSGEAVEIKNVELILDLAQAQEVLDRTAKEKLTNLDKRHTQLLLRLAKNLLEPNLTFNKNKTEQERAAAAAAAKPLYYKFQKGEVIARKGDRLTAEQKYKIKLILTQMQQETPAAVKGYGLLLFLIFFTAFIFTFAERNIKKFRLDFRDLVFLAVVLVVALGCLRGIAFLASSAARTIAVLPEGANFYYLVPLAAAAMLVRMALNSEVALVFSIILAGAGALAADNSLLFGLYTLAGSAAAAGAVGQCRQRVIILRGGLILGIVNILLILFLGLVSSPIIVPDKPYLSDAMLYNLLFGFGSALVSAIVVTGLVPIVEALFGYTTDIKLLELLNQDHPLLKELSINTPGTYQHSLMVANLAEAAAKEVGANPLLARVCAMYHDIGKMEKPSYFAENQWDGVNPHDRLAPSMSTLIIHNHVKEGVELARRHKLPPIVIDAIQQHHGTSLLRYFYEKARELAPNNVAVEEKDFRYPGPKPQSRETAIVLLADVVEATVKSQRDLTPAQLTGLIQNMINRCFVDAQLDECDLTLKNLHDIARNFNHTLRAIYRPRPDYPVPVVKGQPADKKKKAEADAASFQDQSSDQKPDQPPAAENSLDNTLKRLGM